MRMARINVYLPDRLAEAAKDSGLNVSALTQEAVRAALGEARMDAWLDEIANARPTRVTHDEVTAAVDEAKDELEDVG
jgi:post-segregation antitoxin (ccd killing protein)